MQRKEPPTTTVCLIYSSINYFLKYILSLKQKPHFYLSTYSCLVKKIHKVGGSSPLSTDTQHQSAKKCLWGGSCFEEQGPPLNQCSRLREKFSNAGWADLPSVQDKKDRTGNHRRLAGRTSELWPSSHLPLTLQYKNTQNTKVCKHSCLILKHNEENVYRTHYFVLHIWTFFQIEMSMGLSYFAPVSYFLLHIFMIFFLSFKRRKKWPEVSL